MRTTAVPEARRRAVLEVSDLTVEFETRAGRLRVVDGVDFEVAQGETLGVVGQSGAGKSVTMLAALGLLPSSARLVRGAARLEGVDLLQLRPKELRNVRGKDIGMVFQDPLTSMHPSFRVGDQIAEAIRLHDAGVSRAGARIRAIELLELVGVPFAARRWRDHPHQWSGGMRQRAMIAMAIANGPKLLVADESTTALDVTVQAQVLGVLRDVQRETGTAIVLITHDLGVIAEMADTVVVLHEGRAVESGTVGHVFASPRLPYTAGLLARGPSRSRLRPAAPRVDSGPVLEVRDLVTHFRSRSGRHSDVVHAVDGVSFDLHPGESLGVVGESGCGKSTLVRTIVRLLHPTSGTIRFEGRDITGLAGRDLREVRARLRIVFQDSFSALNPRRSVGDIVAEPLRTHGRHGAGGGGRVRELFEMVGLQPDLSGRYPHQLSGGQRQRVGIARALALEPKVLVLDEPVSSLDVPIQAQILELLERLQRDLGLAYVFVSHDLTVVRRICDRVAVMYVGRFVEVGDTATVYADPAHPYTRALLSAVPITSPAERGSGRRIVLVGDLPDPAAPPSGCRFHTRCWLAFDRCVVDEPTLQRIDAQRVCSCHLVSPIEAASIGESGFLP